MERERKRNTIHRAVDYFRVSIGIKGTTAQAGCASFEPIIDVPAKENRKSPVKHAASHSVPANIGKDVVGRVEQAVEVRDLK